MNDDWHESSIENDNISDKTELIENSDGNNGQMQIEETIPEVALQMVFIGPCDTLYYDGLRKKFKSLSGAYSKDKVIEVILENAKFQGVTNLKNL